MDRLTFGGNIIETGTDSYDWPTPGPADRTQRLIQLMDDIAIDGADFVVCRPRPPPRPPSPADACAGLL